VVLEEALAPFLPVEVLDLLELLEVAELVLKPAVALPGHHPDVTPLVPECLGTWASHVLAHAGTAKKVSIKESKVIKCYKIVHKLKAIHSNNT